jgi:hypothetical protein
MVDTTAERPSVEILSTSSVLGFFSLIQYNRAQAIRRTTRITATTDMPATVGATTCEGLKSVPLVVVGVGVLIGETLDGGGGVLELDIVPGFDAP